MKSKPNGDGLTFTHEAFRKVVSSNLQESQCGALSYIATFQGEVIDLDSSIMIYDSENHEFSVFTDDRELIGAHSFTVKAYLTDYP